MESLHRDLSVCLSKELPWQGEMISKQIDPLEESFLFSLPKLTVHRHSSHYDPFFSLAALSLCASCHLHCATGLGSRQQLTSTRGD